jgi:prepilin signal peptidase PulO-like enzyme (type II secretory pathway)
VLYFLSFFIGAAIGSFTLVVVNRLHIAPIINGRSKCFSCGKKLTWKELVPVISFFIQKGKCTSCNARIGVDHVAVEIVYGLLFTLFYILFLEGKGITPTTALWTVYYSTVFVVSGVLVLYDMRHKVVPERFLFAFIGLSAIMMFVRLLSTGNIYELITPFVISLPTLAVYYLTKKRGIGLGDVILFSGIGMFLGTESALAAVIISVWSAAIVGVSLQMFNSKEYHMKYALPFVPFMIISTLFVLFTDINVWTLVGLFS